MKRNMSVVDRSVRLLLAAAIVVLYLLDFISGLTAIIFLVVASIFVLTGIIGNCPLYSILDIRTRAKKDALHKS